MSFRNAGMWRTNDGRTLEIAWMDSTHVANSANLIIRDGRAGAFNNSHKKEAPIIVEAETRRLFSARDGDQKGLFIVPLRRETPDEMIMLNVLILVGHVQLKTHTLKHIAKHYPDIFAQYVKLKLTR